MTSLDERREEYEDALFGVLMQHAMDAEGSALRIHNERCKQAEQSISPETDARCRKAVTDEFAARDAQLKRKKRSRVFRTLLIAAIVFTMMFSTVYASVPAVQEKVAEMRAHFSGDSLRFFVDTDKEEYLQSNYIKLGGYWIEIPAGFRVTYLQRTTFLELAVIEFGDKRIQYCVSEGTETFFVNDYSVEHIYLNGYDAVVLYDEEIEMTSIFIPDSIQKRLIQIEGSHVDRKELERLAREMIFVGQEEPMESTDPVWCGAIPSLTNQFELREKTDTHNASYRLYAKGDQKLSISIKYDVGDNTYVLMPENAYEVLLGACTGYLLEEDGTVTLRAATGDYRVFVEIIGENVDAFFIENYMIWLHVDYVLSDKNKLQMMLTSYEQVWENWPSTMELPKCVEGIFGVGVSDNLGVRKGYRIKNGWVVLSMHHELYDMMAFADAYDGEPVTINGNDGYYLKRPNGEYIISFDAERKVYLEVLTTGKPGQNIYDLAEEFRFREE